MTFSEEIILKPYTISRWFQLEVSTNAIAEMMETIFSNGHAQEISRKRFS
jgi:hypothetical protein